MREGKGNLRGQLHELHLSPLVTLPFQNSTNLFFHPYICCRLTLIYNRNSFLPQRKSREEAAIPLAEKLCNNIIQSFPTLQDELLLDDRDHLTIGRRVTDAKKLGYPYIIIVAKRVSYIISLSEGWK